MSEVVCPRCQAELDPAVGVCPDCGASMRSGGAGNEPPWRRQIRETVQRRKQLRLQQMEKREEEGRQLSIFPDDTASDQAEDDVVKQRRAEIRARVEEKLARPRQRTRGPFDAGEVAIPLGSASALAITAPALETEFEAADATQQVEEAPVEPLPSLEIDAELASPGERLLSGFIDLGLVTLMLTSLAYLTVRVAGYPLRVLPSSALAALGVIGFLLLTGYFLFFWSLSGQTLGKLLTRSRVVTRQGGPLGFGRALLRGLGLIAACLPLGAGFLGWWSDVERRGWHDRVASTKVIRA